MRLVYFQSENLLIARMFFVFSHPSIKLLVHHCIRLKHPTWVTYMYSAMYVQALVSKVHWVDGYNGYSRTAKYDAFHWWRRRLPQIQKRGWRVDWWRSRVRRKYRRWRKDRGWDGKMSSSFEGVGEGGGRGLKDFFLLYYSNARGGCRVFSTAVLYCYSIESDKRHWFAAGRPAFFLFFFRFLKSIFHFRIFSIYLFFAFVFVLIDGLINEQRILICYFVKFSN